MCYCSGRAHDGRLSLCRMHKFVSRMEEILFDFSSEAETHQCLSPDDTEIQNKMEQKFQKLKTPVTPFDSETK